MKTFDITKQLALGVCYYPEQWPAHMWEDDLIRMKEVGISMIRIAEFAWSVFEREEGTYSFELFDTLIDLAHAHDIKVIIGTPTATPPAWLTAKYPEVLNATIEGHQLQHGLRRHTNYTSTTYHALCANITKQLVTHYANHPAVIGWQIDNEFNCEISEFYSESDHIAFRNWVKNKYVHLDGLNEAWGTAFWSQTYTDWEQIYLPRIVPGGKQPNPHLALDEKRFISDSVIAFANIQTEIIKQLAPHHFITTNGLFGHLNSHQLTNELLDFFSYDSYPQFSTIFYDANEERPLLDRSWSQTLSTVRSISPTFCIMEQQAGPGGWVNKMDMPSPKPGQLRLWSYQSLAHGANLVVYFRWRTATFGQEIYWHGLNDYSNKPNRRLREAAQVGEEFKLLSQSLAGTTYEANVAILRDYDNEWDGEYDVWHGPFGWKSGKEWFKALTRHHIPSDIVYIEKSTTLTQLLKYKLLIYPHPAIMDQATADLLEQYVEAGGQLILGCRTGYKDKRGHCYMIPFPGVAARLTGIELEEYTVIKGTRKAPSITFVDCDTLVSTCDFNEIIEPMNENVEVIATYASDYYKGKPALTKHTLGKGHCWYYGSVFHEQIANEILSRLPELTSPAKWLDLPAEVELAVRSNGTKKYYILLNYSEEAVTAHAQKLVRNLLDGSTVQGSIQLKGYDVLLLEDIE